MSDKINYEQLDGASSVARRDAGIGGKIGMAAIGLLLIGGLGYINWPSQPVSQDAVPTDEEFKTTEFKAPNLAEGLQPSEQPTEQIVIPVPGDEVPAQSGNVEQTVQEGVDLEAQRRLLEEQLAAEEARRKALEDEARRKADEEEAARQALLEEERRKAVQERLLSPQMITDEGGEDNGQVNGNQQPAEVAADGQLVPVAGMDTDPNKAFLAQSEMSTNTASVAVINRRTDALVAEGTMIRGFLETAINTDLPGMVRAVVREDVYSLDGRRVLIPKGSRLIGEYKSGLARGQKRVFIVWNRMMRSDGVSVRIGSPGTDSLGRAGMSGRLDTHWVERYGSAIMLSIVGGAAEYLSSLANPNDNNQAQRVTTIDPVTGQTIITEYGASEQEARANAFQRGSSSLQELAKEAFQDSRSIPPTVYVDQGTPIIVFLRRDLDFSSLYADPVQEELLRLKRGGGKRVTIDPIPLYATPKDDIYLGGVYK